MPVVHRRRLLVPADVAAGVALDPEALFAAWLGDREHAFWLDSSAAPGASLIGWGDPFGRPDEGSEAGPGLYDRIDALLGPVGAEAAEAEPAPALEADPDPATDAEPSSTGRPRRRAVDPLREPVLVGWIGYEPAIAEADPALAERLGLAPEATDTGLVRVRRAIRFDPPAGVVEAIGVAAGPDAAEAELAGLLAELAALPPAPAPPADSPPDPAPPAAVLEPGATPPVVSWHDDREAYLGLIADCHERIRSGDAYQLCLTTRARVRTGEPGLAIHRRLRRLAPAPYGAFVRAGGAELSVASPELFLDVAVDSEGAATVTTRPIKGTRPRGPERAEDARLAGELVESPKERAENLMIVDLMRNDLGRLAPGGAVEVPDLLRVESHPTVHQLVSTVRARLRPGTSVGDLLRSALPAGSMTGAPKLSAIAILHSLEGAPRRAYAGCVGVFGARGTVRLAMTIRGILLAGGTATVGAGGGITILSEPDEEWEEVLLKARAPLAALGAGTAGPAAAGLS